MLETTIFDDFAKIVYRMWGTSYVFPGPQNNVLWPKNVAKRGRTDEL